MKKIVLVDGNNLLFRSYYATAYSGSLMKNSKGLPTNALFGFINMITKIVNEEKPEYMMIAFDKGKTFRHEKYADYKGGRSETPDELKIQFPIAKELCTILGIKYLEMDNYEADDIIGSYAKLIDESSIYEGLIVSSDKDLLQLISDKVKVKLLKTKDYIMMDKKEFNKVYGLDPIKMIDIKALMGDPSDNIPGVKGIGEKTALSLLQKFGSLDNLYKNINEVTGKTREKLIDDKDNAYFSYEIATIYKDIPLDKNIDTIKYLGIDELKYREKLEELEFFSLLKKTKMQDRTDDIKYTLVNDLNEIDKEDNYSIYLEVLGYNYHKAKPLGVSLSTKNNNYFIPINLLENTDFFSDKLQKYTYDLKKVLVVFNKLNIKIDNKINDLMIEAYLLNKNIKNDIAYLSNSMDYNIMFYDKEFGTEITIKEIEENIYQKNACLKSNFIYKERETFLNELDKEKQLDLYNDIELPLVSVLAKMEINGIKVDREYLEDYSSELIKETEKIEKEIYEVAGSEFNISSPKQLSDMLFVKMGLPYPKRLVKGEYSTSKDILEKINHPIIDLILKYRTLTKLNSTYLIGLQDEILEDNKIHTIYNQALTRTGRLSSERPNLQNIPIRIEEGRLIRKAFVPESRGGLIISGDYSQIELRVFAHMSGEKNLLDAFKNDLDIHAKTAADIFNVDIDKVDKNMRRSAKAVNFGIIYGISGYGLSEDLGVNLSDAKEFMDKYLETFPGIRDYREQLVKDAYKNGFVTTLFNRKRVIDELNNKNYMIRQSGERMALNTPIQGTAADILKLAMIKIDKEIEKHNLNTKMIVQVHDELVFDVPDNEVEEFIPILKDSMEKIYKLDCPLKVDIEYGKTWYEAK